MRRVLRPVARSAFLAAGVLPFVLSLACLDADPLAPGAGGARLSISASYVPAPEAQKALAPDSLRVVLYDVTDDLYTDEPEDRPVAAERVTHSSIEDETGIYFISEVFVDLLEPKVFRVVARLSLDGSPSREVFAGERTIALGPGDRKSVGMVVTDAVPPAPGDYGLAIAKSVARSGARRHAIPIVLRNGDPIGGLQFQVRFDKAALDSVIGVEVDPSSRLYAGDTGDSLIGSRYAQPTDSTLRVVTVDLGPAVGDSLAGGLRPIPAGNDLLLFLLVDVADTFPALPDTIRLALEEVFFSAPSGSTDVVVTDARSGLLIVGE